MTTIVGMTDDKEYCSGYVVRMVNQRVTYRRFPTLFQTEYHMFNYLRIHKLASAAVYHVLANKEGGLIFEQETPMFNHMLIMAIIDEAAARRPKA